MPTKKEIDDKVKEVFKYAKTLIGLKYTWWTGDDREDFHYYDLPDFFANLIRDFLFPWIMLITILIMVCTIIIHQLKNKSVF